MKDGLPAFVIIPYEEYLRVFAGKHLIANDNIPHEVVGLTIKKGYSLVRAWREYLKLTQKEVAGRMGVTQAALSQIESGRQKLRKDTLKKLAKALNLTEEQLRE